MPGFDLAQKLPEIENLYYAIFARRARLVGLIDEDVLQRVYLALLTRAEGGCPWDERRGSWSGYVCMIISQQLAAEASRVLGRQAVEVLGGLGTGESDPIGDAAEDAVDADTPGAILEAKRLLTDDWTRIRSRV